MNMRACQIAKQYRTWTTAIARRIFSAKRIAPQQTRVRENTSTAQDRPRTLMVAAGGSISMNIRKLVNVRELEIATAPKAAPIPVLEVVERLIDSMFEVPQLQAVLVEADSLPTRQSMRAGLEKTVPFSCYRRPFRARHTSKDNRQLGKDRRKGAI